MTKPAALEGDKVVGVDTHIVMIPSPGGPVPTPLPHPFNGTLEDSLSTSVKFENKAVALIGSVANNTPHVPQGGTFQTPPSNKGTVSVGSDKVIVNNKGVARMGDTVKCCNDPTDQDTGQVIATSKVLVG
jgi:uncharacterized Zn-binding protein involved in type VI secretion